MSDFRHPLDLGHLEWTAAHKVPVIMSNALRDGHVIYGIDPAYEVMPTMCLMIGTRPLTDVEMAGLEGRYIVRQGMADVLEYIGEEVGPPPRREGRGREFYDKLLERTVPA